MKETTIIGNYMQQDMHLLYDLGNGVLSFQPADVFVVTVDARYVYSSMDDVYKCIFGSKLNISKFFRGIPKKKLCIIALFGERTKYLQIALAIFYLDWVRCCILTFDPRVRQKRMSSA